MRPSFGFGKGPSWTATSTTATEPPGPHVPRRRRAWRPWSAGVGC